MSLTARDVAEITRLLEESSFDELYLEFEGLKLSLKRGSAAQVAGSVPAAPGVRATESAAPRATEPTASHVPEGGVPAAPPGDLEDVAAPLLGTFYRAPKPGNPPFVEVGSPVEPDTIVGIIEVMKLMNTVRAGVSGRVSEILARDGMLVEYGETLLRVAKAV
ncbi:MAG TPA: acetyl-CoA carboxylase biotin carboxyl carrier protein [Steroidobacteraceae bacterium]|nr:acetyl-CoA carboxylase biotin carboxyl carrier protein [Steroidobacteraceae bacterium]